MSRTHFVVARFGHIVQHAVSPLFAPLKRRAKLVALVPADATGRQRFAGSVLSHQSVG